MLEISARERNVYEGAVSPGISSEALGGNAARRRPTRATDLRISRLNIIYGLRPPLGHLYLLAPRSSEIMELAGE